jgi:hypothetical protein
MAMSEEREYPLFPAENMPSGYGAPLIDHVKRVDERRDDAVAETIAAFNEHKEEARVDELANRYGRQGTDEILYFRDRLRQVGPNVANELRQHYQTKTRPTVPEFEERQGESDHARSTRLSVWQLKQKETPEQKAVAKTNIRRIADEDGTLDTLDRYGAIHDDYSRDPYGAALRTGRGIAEDINNGLLDQQARKQIKDYERRWPISDEARPHARYALEHGYTADLAQAHQFGDFIVASDVEDPYQRAVASGARQADLQTYADAYRTRWDFDKKLEAAGKPGLTEAEREEMSYLLESGRVKTIDQAFRKVRK